MNLSADSKGSVCPFENLLENSCCKVEFDSKPACSACDEQSSCCSVYENCVGCCILNIKEMLEKHGGNIKLPFSYLFDRDMSALISQYQSVIQIPFDWCELRCRTSSRSVVQQNRYRSNLKHCYGTNDSPLLPHV